VRLIWTTPLGTRKVWEGEWSDLLEKSKWCLRVNALDALLLDVADLVI